MEGWEQACGGGGLRTVPKPEDTLLVRPATGAEATPDLRGLEGAGSGGRGREGGRELEAGDWGASVKGARGSGLGKRLEAGGVGVGVGRS